MTHEEMLTALRFRVGNPPHRDIPDTRLDSFLTSGLQWMAGELDFNIPTVTLALVEDDYDYELPADLLQVLWVEWNENKLAPGSLRGWTRDGTDWRNATSTNPSQYAIEGWKLYIFPPPSDDAITTDPNFTLSYIAGAPSLDGLTGLAPPDYWLAVWRGAWEFLGTHPGVNPEEVSANRSRRETARETIGTLLPEAKRRHADAIRPQHARLRVFSARMGGAR